MAWAKAREGVGAVVTQLIVTEGRIRAALPAPQVKDMFPVMAALAAKQKRRKGAFVGRAGW